MQHALDGMTSPAKRSQSPLEAVAAQAVVLFRPHTLVA